MCNVLLHLNLSSLLYKYLRVWIWENPVFFIAKKKMLETHMRETGEEVTSSILLIYTQGKSLPFVSFERFLLFFFLFDAIKIWIFCYKERECISDNEQTDLLYFLRVHWVFSIHLTITFFTTLWATRNHFLQYFCVVQYKKNVICYQ